MTDRTCPLCALHVPPLAGNVAPELEDCPRCLARTAGAVSVKLINDPPDHDAQSTSGVTSILHQLLPGGSRQ
jgi:hypothetical protein